VHHSWWHFLAPFWGAIHNFLPWIIGGGGAAGGSTLWQKWRQRKAAAWPSADGEVQSVSVRSGRGYNAVIQYRYFAQSQYRYGKYARHFRRKKDAEAFADALRGRHIQVRYQADKPEVSVVLDQDLRMTGALQMG